MANGTSDEKLARADRIKEQSVKAQKRAEQHQKATANAIAAIRNRELPAYRDSMDSGEVTANTSGLHLKGIPRESWKWIALASAFFIACLGLAVVRALW